ncbi:hypothetical protein LTR78_007219 [Recurvomyces mirabilis]|uniref:Mso1 N-terminal domain-containing protein n=1 Tax=Recurvomyces mirabilis TaxID=574656 RepID=A0AAE0WJH9_9PEZI|nr:hypothetical protein LTR78_007219 [Recurvomyces mirabilis]KAK5155538.1 hypothetical protein LTS14_005799 [Recurvomyces mirabilis]
MSSYLSNLLTQTTSRYNSLRRTLLSNEEDGDTEDDSHISRVLRAYYTEKGRPFPPWLPPDPNDRRAITPQPVYAQQPSYMTSAGSRSQLSNVQNTAGSRGSLSDLWDAPTQPAAPMQPTSLRAGRRPMQPATNPASTLAPPAQARPLPSQRAGSYQSVQSQRGGAVEQSPPGSSGGGGTAQERLKARLWGGNRAASPGLSSGGVGSSNPYDQPVGNPPYNSGGGNPYDTGGGESSRRYGR